MTSMGCDETGMQFLMRFTSYYLIADKSIIDFMLYSGIADMMEVTAEISTSESVDTSNIDPKTLPQSQKARSRHPHASEGNARNENLVQCGNLFLVFDYVEVRSAATRL